MTPIYIFDLSFTSEDDLDTVTKAISEVINNAPDSLELTEATLTRDDGIFVDIFALTKEVQ
jgi:hypothetical protein